MDYKNEAKKRIDIANISRTCNDRLSDTTIEMMKSEYVVDSHSHMFDIKCINKSYFIIRFIKDFLGLKSNGEDNVEFSLDEAYEKLCIYEEGWERELLDVLEGDSDIMFRDKSELTKGFIDVAKATKYLSFDKMIKVYNHYIKNYSLAESFGMPQSNVITTALSMDLETGWDVKIKKKLYSQITELKELALSKPVLPFLFCDPRRADIEDVNNNLYSLFDYAFCKAPSFFGIKIYPSLGYDPSDYRLWPIYEICQKYSIPVLTHCGGESISTDQLSLEVFVGEESRIVTANNRKEIAYDLNNPNRWEMVLQKFPNLKLNFGHFGGYETWKSSSKVDTNTDPQQRKECIFSLMEKYPNVFADFAFNFVEENLSDNLINVLAYNETVRERTLFGTDYWMVTPKGNLKKEQVEFIKKLNSIPIDNLNLVNKLVIDNPNKYLFD